MPGGLPDPFWTLPDSLRELAEGGNDDLVKEVLSAFLNDSSNRLALLRAALASGDRSQIYTQAHAFKGSSAQVGADGVAAVCREMERLAPTAGMDDLNGLMGRIESDFGSVRTAILRQYGA